MRQLEDVAKKADRITEIEESLAKLREQVGNAKNEPVDLGFTKEDVARWHESVQTTMQQVEQINKL